MLKLLGVLRGLREVPALNADISRPLLGNTDGWEQQATACEEEDGFKNVEWFSRDFQQDHEEFFAEQGPFLLFHF